MTSAVRKVTGVLTAAAVALVGAIYSASPAMAATALASWSPVTSSAASASYTFRTSLPYWSVVGVKPPTSADYDLVVSPGTSSLAGGSTVDFVAIDTNLCPARAYTATVNRYSGSGTYTVELADQHEILNVDPLPFPDHNPNIATDFGPGIATPDHFIAVVDVYLIAGRPTEFYAAHVGGSPGDVYVMAPNPDRCVQSPGNAIAHGRINSGGNRSVTLRFTPTRTGWYGLVQLTYGPDPQNGYSSMRIGQ